MTETVLNTTQAGQSHDPGYPVPALAIGQVISGHTVIAAIREIDVTGLLPGLHVVTAYDPTNPITWQRCTVEGHRVHDGRWVANAGHYTADVNEALADMAKRARPFRPAVAS